jgi:hypothetical protein
MLKIYLKVSRYLDFISFKLNIPSALFDSSLKYEKNYVCIIRKLSDTDYSDNR